MRRRAIADWSAGVIAIIVLALGALVVVKPAIDHWNDVYRADPFKAATTTQTVRAKAADPAQRTTITRKESSSTFERSLGKGGLLLLRLAVVFLTAFLAAALVQRVVLGNYGIRSRPRAQTADAPVPAGAIRAPEAQPGEKPVAVGNGQSAEGNGAPAEANGNSAELASSIGRFVAWRREELGLSQRELAKRAGISHTVISRLESGQQVPSPKTLERLADAFRTN
jgi:DNA-binding XRE family transcriptional regulator